MNPADLPLDPSCAEQLAARGVVATARCSCGVSWQLDLPAIAAKGLGRRRLYELAVFCSCGASKGLEISTSDDGWCITR